MEQLIQTYLPKDWSKMDDDVDYKLVKIKRKSKLFNELANKTKCYDDACTIYRIENPMLYAQFLLKKKQYELTLKKSNVVYELFHCTHEDFLDSIADSNFDYRQISRGKFGNGVCFSPDPDYAHKVAGNTGCMIVADVLIGHTSVVDWPYWPEYDLPSHPTDTTQNKNCTVYVKYQDNEFYPKYAVTYYDETD